MIDQETLLARLRDEVAIPAGETERLTVKLTAARQYVAHAVGDATVTDELLADCIVACAADLYNMRDARLGVMDVGTVPHLHRPFAQRLASPPRRRSAHRKLGGRMTNNRISKERSRLIDLLADTLGTTITSVGIDAQAIRPAPGKVAIFVEPPTVEYDSWGPPTTTWTLDLVAGTPATQATALDDIMDALETLASNHLNIKDARPATWNLAGSGSLAAYQITLNPLDLIEESEE